MYDRYASAEVVWTGSRYAGQLYDRLPAQLTARFGGTVPFSNEGFADFDEFASKTVRLPGGFEGPSRRDDVLLANEVFGWEHTPRGWCWHYCEDGETMQLVDRELHRHVAHTCGLRVAKAMMTREQPRDRQFRSYSCHPMPSAENASRSLDDQLDEIEDRCGYELPAEYLEFLKDIGGLYFDDTDVPGTRGDGLMQELSDAAGLLRMLDLGRDTGLPAFVPANYLMIGQADGGAPCLRLAGGDAGSLWWADWETATSRYAIEGPHEEVMIRLGDGLWDFLGLLGDIQEPTSRADGDHDEGRAEPNGIGQTA